jgi:hypothetical protein
MFGDGWFYLVALEKDLENKTCKHDWKPSGKMFYQVQKPSHYYFVFFNNNHNNYNFDLFSLSKNTTIRNILVFVFGNKDCINLLRNTMIHCGWLLSNNIVIFVRKKKECWSLHATTICACVICILQNLKNAKITTITTKAFYDAQPKPRTHKTYVSGILAICSEHIAITT